MSRGLDPVDLRPTRIRYRILALIAVATMINYLDRTLLSVAAPFMARDLDLQPAALGIVFSAFSWSYALAQLPGGALLDRWGTRVVYCVSLLGWSALTAMQGAVTSITTLLGVRLALGAAEAPCFPANSRILVSWFPRGERARANSVYSVGMYFGIAFLSPLLFWITVRFGWRILFAGVGMIGVAYGLAWWKFYRDPHAHPHVNAAELREIEDGGGHTAQRQHHPFSWAKVRWLLAQRQVIGASLGQFATNATLVFFLTWFPTYLARERHMDWLSVGFYAVLPFIAASLGVLFGGQLSDWLLRRTGSLTIARKVPVVSGLLLSSLILTAIVLPSNELVIAALSIAFFGQGMSNIGWTLLSEIAPVEMIGVTAGIFNLCTNLAGIVTPIAIGFIVQASGSFVGGIVFVGVIALLGALSYVAILGPVERLRLPAGAIDA